MRISLQPSSFFTSNRLDPTETYAITIMKTNATPDGDLNIDSFILTQSDGADSTFSPPDTNFSTSDLYLPLILLYPPL
jgi:hypothetical protein